jgi:hypothetical protein
MDIFVAERYGVINKRLSDENMHIRMRIYAESRMEMHYEVGKKQCKISLACIYDSFFGV